MKNSYDYEWDGKYCYPNSSVLINKLNITDEDELNAAERKITSLKIAEISDNPVKGEFDLKHLQDIHRHIFKDIYDWAGEIRTVIFKRITNTITKKEQENFINKVSTNKKSPILKAYKKLIFEDEWELER
jgi:cell filamentation protein